MTIECPPDVAALLRTAVREPMVAAAARRSDAPQPELGRREIERLLPHRGSFLFIDRISWLNRDAATIACEYDLGRGGSVFDDHVPGRPTWPGVLQVEAIGQAGLCFVRFVHGCSHDSVPSDAFALTQILGAEFVRPVTPAGNLEIVARVMRDGLFTIVVGQCLQYDAVCCAAALRGISED